MDEMFAVKTANAVFGSIHMKVYSSVIEEAK
jgi:hypothetical protein